MFPDALVRLSARRAYCSGTLVASDTVLTCAHFFRHYPDGVTVRSHRGKIRTITSVDLIDGSDIAVVRIRPFQQLQEEELPTVGDVPRPGQPTVTFGYGGRAKRLQARDGVWITRMPLAISRTGSLVRPAGVVFNRIPAIKGDSGGPVLAGGRVAGVQSLIVDPLGRNSHFAVVNLVPAGLREQLCR
ncbi:S1 family peptidase [Corynebacterium urinipleomorphum]|uniref:S1 family peptidase n=1 Tax=Corynebacterium urinipleomorphum TaxID=1852380 RepID=UPI000B34FF68|nr:serine protease [Corynebacterium urinipleomorphum]